MKSPPITIIHARHAIVGRALFGGAYLQRRARARPCNGAKEIEAFHRARRANFRQPEMFHAAHIVKHVNEEQTGEQADGELRAKVAGGPASLEDVRADIEAAFTVRDRQAAHQVVQRHTVPVPHI
jgi:hypothetical protein